LNAPISEEAIATSKRPSLGPDGSNPIVAGVFGMSSRYTYLFKFEGDKVICERWRPMMYERGVTRRRAAAEPFYSICNKILHEIPPSRPPFYPGSIDVALDFYDGERLKFYFSHDDVHPLAYDLWDMLEALF